MAGQAIGRIVRGVERAALAVAREATVEIVVPVYNEERDLERSVRRLRSYLDARFPFHAIVTIADNASSDQTPAIGAPIRGVRYIRISDKGRGRAIAAAWLIVVLRHRAARPRRASPSSHSRGARRLDRRSRFPGQAGPDRNRRRARRLAARVVGTGAG
jgi:hypothetical protein